MGKVKPLNSVEKLKVVEFLLNENDPSGEAELSSLLSLIYRVVHPSKDCRHADWEKEAQKILKEANG